MGICTQILAYSDIPMHIQPGIIRQTYSGIFRTLLSLTYSEPWFIHNLGKFRTRGIFRALVYLEPWHIWNPRIFRTLGCFVKIVNILYEKNIMNSLNICVIFTPIVCILCKKIWRPRGRGRWILIYPKIARIKQIFICSETKSS